MELNKNLIIKTEPKALKENTIIYNGYRFSILTANLIRIEKAPFLDQATLMVFYRNLEKVDFTYSIDEEVVTIGTNEITLVYDTKKELKENYIIFKSDKENLKRYLNNDYNLRGTCRTLDTHYDGGFCINSDIKDFKTSTLPLENGILSRNGVAVIDDSLNPILDDDGLVKERMDNSFDFYLFLYLNDYKKALDDFYKITGYTPLIPRFVLGNWWSRYHAYKDSEYMATLDKFEAEKVPLSIATIDMDWHHVDLEKDFNISKTPYQNEELYGNIYGWTGFSWDKNLWKDYKKSLKEIHDRGLKVTLNLHPKDGIRWFEDMYSECAKEMGIDPASHEAVKFDMTDSKFINLYFDKVLRPYEENGVDFWWIDYQQDRTTKIKNLDPLWPLNHYQYLDKGLILSRYAELGSHRYPLGFSGDTKMIWEFLELMPYFTFTASNAGYTWWSHDIGAHHYGIKDDELYIRWIEYGVFSPINRIHSNTMDVLSKEPWLTKEPIRLIADHYLRLRHRLIPYIYNYSFLTHEKGLPLIEPLYYEHPLNDECYKDESTYFFGELIASPIISKSKDGYAIKRLYLPYGRYFDINNRRWYKGHRWITIARDLGEFPLFMKEGTILPLSNDIFNLKTEPKDMEINFVSDKAHLDLNETIDESFITSFDSKVCDHVTFINIRTKTDKEFRRDYDINLRYLVDGDIKVFLGKEEIPFTKRNNFSLRVLVKDIDVRKKLIISIKNPTSLTIPEYIHDQALTELSKYNDINEEKEKIYDEIKKIDNISDYRKYISSLNVKKYLKVLLNEITYIE